MAPRVQPGRHKVAEFLGLSPLGFSWSRDGKQIAMARGSRSSDIILISNFR